MSHFKSEFLFEIIIEKVWHTFSTEYGRGPSSRLTGFISGRPSKCLVFLEYWKVHVGQEDTTANISPNPSGYMFLHAANTDSQYWLAGINGDAAIERGNFLPAWETALQDLIFNFGKIFPLPSSLLSEMQNNLRQSASGVLCLLYCCGPSPWNVTQVKGLLKSGLL